MILSGSKNELISFNDVRVRVIALFLISSIVSIVFVIFLSIQYSCEELGEVVGGKGNLRSKYEECEKFSDCKGGYNCVSGLCALNLPHGYPCSGKYDCESLVCEDGSCKEIQKPLGKTIKKVIVYYNRTERKKGGGFVDQMNEFVKELDWDYSFTVLFVGSTSPSQNVGGSSAVFVDFMLYDTQAKLDYFVNWSKTKEDKKKFLLRQEKEYFKLYKIVARTTRKTDCELATSSYDLESSIDLYRQNNVFNGMFSDDLVEFVFHPDSVKTEACEKRNRKDKKVLNFLYSVMENIAAYDEDFEGSNEEIRECLENEVENCGKNFVCTEYIEECKEKIPNAPTISTNEPIKAYHPCSSTESCEKGTRCQDIYRTSDARDMGRSVKVCVPLGHRYCSETGQCKGGALSCVIGKTHSSILTTRSMCRPLFLDIFVFALVFGISWIVSNKFIPIRRIPIEPMCCKKCKEGLTLVCEKCKEKEPMVCEGCKERVTLLDVLFCHFGGSKEPIVCYKCREREEKETLLKKDE